LLEPATAASIDLKLLRPFCREVRFDCGATLREEGQYYRDMYLMTDGIVDVDLQPGGAAKKPVILDAGSPIGEIGFLRGCPATATVTARTAAGALVIDDPTLTRLEYEQPALTAQLLRYLAKTAEERTSSNLTFSPRTYARARAIDVYLCRNKDMLERAQRLRYEVYCRELGRNSPYADHERKIITDELDATGQIFVAIEAGETIGTLRGNRPCEGSLGILEELYGMRTSAQHPQATSICTKFVVERSKRGSPAAVILIAAMVRYGVRNHVKECYIDSTPALLPYYKAIGFRIAGAQFFHRENGPSHPMVIDLVKHGNSLSEEYGTRRYLQLYLRAKIIKWIDSLRGDRALVASS